MSQVCHEKTGFVYSNCSRIKTLEILPKTKLSIIYSSLEADEVRVASDLTDTNNISYYDKPAESNL